MQKSKRIHMHTTHMKNRKREGGGGNVTSDTAAWERRQGYIPLTQ